MLQPKDMGELAKWADRASKIERFFKVRTAYLIFRSQRLVCLVVGCKDRDRDVPCSRCGAHGRIGSNVAIDPGNG